jgi:hypothetical protein
VGENSTRLSLQPKATEAIMEVKERIMRSTYYLTQLIKTRENSSDARFHHGLFFVTAVVAGEEVISSEQIECSLTYNRNHVQLCVFWEEAGFDNYKKLGLYGSSNSNYFDVEQLPNGFKCVDRVSKNTISIFWNASD